MTIQKAHESLVAPSAGRMVSLPVLVHALSNRACHAPEREGWVALNIIFDLIYKLSDHGPFTDEQREAVWRFIRDEAPFAWIASRGASKTECFMIAAAITCTAEPGTDGLWLAGETAQLEEAKKKSNWYGPAFDFEIGKTDISNHWTIKFSNGSMIEFNPTTKTSGMRKNLLIRDEGGKIRKADAIQRWKEASGVMEGTFRWPVRDRYCSTPTIGSAFDGPDDYLEEKGCVLKHDYTRFSWVLRDKTPHDVISMYGEPFFNCEYRCIKDAPGGKIFSYYKKAPPDWQPLPQDFCVIGIDWNGGWGHAAVVAFQRGNIITVFDEYRSLAITRPVKANDKPITDKSGLPLDEWCKAWKGKVYAGNFMVIAEKQGYDWSAELAKLGVDPMTTDDWTGVTQRARVPLTVAALASERVLIHPRCKALLDQLDTVHYDEAGNIPRQEDHHVDALHHVMLVAKRARVVMAQTAW